MLLLLLLLLSSNWARKVDELMVDMGQNKGEGKGGKYLEKGNIFFAEEKKNGEGKIHFLLWRRKPRRKRIEIFGEGKYIFC